MNPTHFQDIKQYVNKSAEEAVEKQKRDEEIMGGFMVITPEMTEDEIIEERIDV